MKFSSLSCTPLYQHTTINQEGEQSKYLVAIFVSVSTSLTYYGFRFFNFAIAALALSSLLFWTASSDYSVNKFIKYGNDSNHQFELLPPVFNIDIMHVQPIQKRISVIWGRDHVSCFSFPSKIGSSVSEPFFRTFFPNNNPPWQSVAASATRCCLSVFSHCFIALQLWITGSKKSTFLLGVLSSNGSGFVSTPK